MRNLIKKWRAIAAAIKAIQRNYEAIAEATKLY
jgi:hypothetical protein